MKGKHMRGCVRVIGKVLCRLGFHKVHKEEYGLCFSYGDCKRCNKYLSRVMTKKESAQRIRSGESVINIMIGVD